jgi:hypothetical protein
LRRSSASWLRRTCGNPFVSCCGMAVELDGLHQRSFDREGIRPSAGEHRARTTIRRREVGAGNGKGSWERADFSSGRPAKEREPIGDRGALMPNCVVRPPPRERRSRASPGLVERRRSSRRPCFSIRVGQNQALRSRWRPAAQRTEPSRYLRISPSDQWIIRQAQPRPSRSIRASFPRTHREITEAWSGRRRAPSPR